ncbi:MAG: IPT/TIG domain-containing protein, partial [Bacillota bacterium]
MPAQAAGPVITEVSPAIVPAGGGQIMIHGTDLGGVDVRVIMQIGAEILVLDDEIMLATPNLVIVTVPAHEVDATGVKQVDSLVVSNSNGSSVPKVNPFRYMGTPVISHSYPFTTVDKYDDAGNPSQDEDDKKTYLKIEGGYFDWVDKVYLKEKGTPDGSALKFGNFPDAIGPLYQDVADGGIYIEVTNILRGKEVQIKAENIGGYSSPWNDSAYYNVPGPYVTTFYPNPNPIFVGTELNLSGWNFLNGDPDNTRVYIGGVEAEKIEVQSTSIRVRVPSPLPANRDLKIEVWNGAVRRGVAIYKNALTIQALPTGIVVDQVLPNHGPTGGGNQVIVVGERFDQTMTVAFEIGGHTTLATTCETVEPPAYLPASKTAFRVTVPPSYQGRQGAAIVKIVDSNQPDLIYDQKPNLYFYSTQGQYLDLQSISPDNVPFDQPTTILLQGQYFSYFRYQDSTKRLELPDGTVVDIGDPDNIDLGATGASRLKLIEEKPGYYQGKTFRIERIVQVTTGGVAAAIKKLNTVGNIQYITANSGFYPLGDKVSEKVDVEVNISESTFYDDGGVWKPCIDETHYPLQEVDSLVGALTVTRVYPDPEITAITPSWGPNLRSQEVLIQGYNFYEGVTVTFGGLQATILGTERGEFTPGKGTLITLRVANPTTSERGEVDVVVKNTDGKSATGKYTYVSSPAITAVTPDLAPLSGGNHITVSGQQFMFGSGVVIGDKVICSEETEDAMRALIADTTFKQVVFGSDLPLTLVVDTGYRVIGADGNELESYDTRPEGVKIVFEVPPGVTAGKKDVYVLNIDKGWSSLPEGFLYKNDTGTPANITVQPNEGDVKGGEEVVITVLNNSFLSQVYNPATGYGVIVTIDGAVAAIKEISDGNHKITVTTPPGSRVEQWTPVEVMNISSEGIRLDVIEDGFMYHRVLTLPEITDFFPKHGQRGTMVTIFGQYFAIDPNTQVLFGNQVLTQADHQVKVINNGMITFPVPGYDAAGNPLPPGFYEIKVKNPDTGTATAAERFELQIPSSRPRIEDIDGDGVAIRPTRGPVNGGVDIFIEGYDFYGQGLEVYIGGQPATGVKVDLLEYDSTIGVWSRCLIRAKTPALAPGLEPGAVDVMVVNPDGGTAIAPLAFTYVTPTSKPVIDSIQPSQGSSAGNLEVVITGSDFQVARDGDNNIIAWPTVTFGGYQAVIIKDDTITRTQGRQIRVTTPTYPGGGKVDVTITNPDTGTYTKTGAFTFVASQPVITSVVPGKYSRHHSSWGLIIGDQFVKPRSEPDPNDPDKTINLPGTDVLLSNQGGTFFTSLAGQTTMDGVVYDNIQVLSATQIRIIIPPAERTGSRILRIVNPDGGQ